MFHTCEVCTIWPEAGIVKGLFWNTSFLKPHPHPTPHTLSSHERLTTWTRFLVSSQISSNRLYSKAWNHELECDSPCSLNSIIHNFIKNSRRRHQPSLCSDCSISTKNLAAVCRSSCLKAVDIELCPSFMWFTTSAYIHTLFNNKGSFSTFDRDTLTNI